jgi:hypothetical protein
MRVGQIVEIYVFSEKLKGTVLGVNKNKTLLVDVKGIRYPNVQTFTQKTFPTKRKEIPSWYILK